MRHWKEKDCFGGLNQECSYMEKADYKNAKDFCSNLVKLSLNFIIKPSVMANAIFSCISFCPSRCGQAGSRSVLQV